LLPYFIRKKNKNTLPIWVVKNSNLKIWLKDKPEHFSNWLSSNNFKNKVGNSILIPDLQANIAGLLVVVPKKISIWSLAEIPNRIQDKEFYIDSEINMEEEKKLVVGWGLGTYLFSVYKKNNKNYSSLFVSKKVDWVQAKREIEAVFFSRNLINLPANDLGPDEFETTVRDLCEKYKAGLTVISGNKLLKSFPAIYTVGNASSRRPRLINFRWGKNTAPKLVLIGKSVCFDSGGLDIKSSIGMRKMKKDMGGGAIVLGLAKMIMDSGMNIDLRVLLPTVENVIGENAYKPGDIIKTKSGITVEVGNTDAEGRLILADAITEGNKTEPDLMISVATLTGAARVALGTELPALFSSNDELVQDLKTICKHEEDYFWQLPLWKNYENLISSSIADLNNSGSSPFGGAITAALFLQKFVKNKENFIHIDAYAWNDKSAPGRPVGGEASLLRALYYFLHRRYS